MKKITPELKQGAMELAHLLSGQRRRYCLRYAQGTLILAATAGLIAQPLAHAFGFQRYASLALWLIISGCCVIFSQFFAIRSFAKRHKDSMDFVVRMGNPD